MKIKRDEFLGYVFIICMMIFYSMDRFNEIREFFMYLGLVAGIIHIVISIKMRAKVFFLYTVFSVIQVISFIHAHDTRILVLVVAMLCGITLDRCHIINVMFYTKLVCFIIMMLTGGYGHINGVSIHAGVLLMLYICKHDTINIFKFCVILMFYIIIATYTHTGTFIVCMGVGIAMVVLLARKHQIHFLVDVKMTFVYPICLFLNYFFAAGIGDEIMPYIGDRLPDIVNSIYITTVEFLDKVTSSRLTLTKYSYLKFGVSLWGGNVNYSQLDLGMGGYFNLDSGFMWLLQGGGILLTIGYMTLTVFLMRYLIRNKLYHYIIAGILIALWSINEDILLGFGTNYLAIFMGKAVIDYITERNKSRSEHTKKNSLLLVWK